jgi:hypothetical protein
VKASSLPRRAALWGALGLATLGAWRLAASSAPADDDPSLILDRAWVDSRPDKFTDYVNAFYASKYGQTGVFQKASSYDYHFELTTFRRDAGKLVLTFPQTGKTAEVSFSVRACRDLPPFDLCLELSDNPWGGPRRYHAMKEQEDESATLGKTAKSLRAAAGE